MTAIQHEKSNFAFRMLSHDSYTNVKRGLIEKLVLNKKAGNYFFLIPKNLDLHWHKDVYQVTGDIFELVESVPKWLSKIKEISITDKGNDHKSINMIYFSDDQVSISITTNIYELKAKIFDAAFVQDRIDDETVRCLMNDIKFINHSYLMNALPPINRFS